MKFIGTVFAFLLMIGCSSQQDPKVELVESFWKAMETNDAATLRQVLSDPKQADFFAGGEVGLAVDAYEVLEPIENGVSVRFSRHCFPDMILPTVIANIEGEPKIDLMATFRAQMEGFKNSKPLKQYCYDFVDQPLKGIVNGQSWEAHHMHAQVIDYGSRKEENLSIVAEECVDPYCMSVSSPKILASNLDLSSEGGNLGNQNNVTIHTPPSDNLMVTAGSYRVSKTPEGKTKLELAIDEGAENSINGYIIY